MLNQFKYSDDTFQLTTINRQKTFYYKLTKPVEVWGNYHTQIAFFDQQNKIIYHRQTCFTHAFQDDNSLAFVKWSDNGDAALFYEYRRGHIENDGVYQYLLIDLSENAVYRIDLYMYDYAFLDNLQSYQFDKKDIISKISTLGIKQESCFTDEISISPIKWLTGVDKWKPSGRL